MNVATNPEVTISRLAAAIGEPARVRILYSLLDGHARTSTELAVVADVSPSTTSVHLGRLMAQRLIKVFVQGKHRYYSLDGADVAGALEALDVLAGRARATFVPSTPGALLVARTCYDHIAGKMGVLLHDRFTVLGWMSVKASSDDHAYDLTPAGTKGFKSLGIDIDATRTQRRRFAYPCLDWSERQPHVGGALGAAILKAALKREWVTQELDSRALRITRIGRTEMLSRFGIQI